MKKTYVTPMILTETYELTRNTSSCSVIKINFVSTGCVLADGDSTPGMIDLALMNGFLTQNDCILPVSDPDPETGEGICYHTSAAMAFTS